MNKLKVKYMKKKKVQKKYEDKPMFQVTLTEDKIEKLMEASEEKGGMVLNVDDQVVIFIKYKED